jgi:DNA-binding NarL/FixJ family response regulator
MVDVFETIFCFNEGWRLSGEQGLRTIFFTSHRFPIHKGPAVRIFIADADKQVRLALQMFLHQEAGIQVTGIAVRSKGLAARLAASEPDVLLLDWTLPDQPISDLLVELGKLEPRPKLVVMAIWPDVEQPALAAGADAFVSKSVPPSELLVVLQTMQQTTNKPF